MPKSPSPSSGPSGLGALLEAVRRRQSGYLLTAMDQPAAEQIAAALAHDPAALDRAARALQIFSLAEAAALLAKDPFLHRLIGIPEGLGPLLQACWKELPPERRRALERMSLFEAGFERDAAERVAGLGLVQLAALASHGLLQRAGEGRYRLPAEVKDLAARQLAQDPAAAAEAQRIHAAYFLSQAALLPPAEAAAKGLLPDLAAAWPRAAAGDLGLMERSAPPLKEAFLKAGAYQALADLAARAEAALEERRGKEEAGACERLLATAWAMQGAALRHLGQAEGSARYLRRAAEAMHVQARRAEAQAVLADLVEHAGRYGSSEGLDKALATHAEDCRRAADEAGEADALRLLGRLEDLRDRPKEMRAHLERAIAYFRRVRNKDKLADCMNILADRALRVGDFKEAKALGEQFLADAGQLVDKGGLVWSQLRVAEVELVMGQFADAIQRLGRALALVDTAKEPWAHAYFTNKLGEACRCAGRLDEAARHHRHGLEEFTALGDAWGMAWCEDFLGYVSVLSGKLEGGRRQLESAEAQFRAMKDRNSLMHCLRHRAEAELAAGQTAAALALAREGLQLTKEGGYVFVELDHLAVIAAALAADPAHQEKAYALMTYTLGAPQASQTTRLYLERARAKLTAALTLLQRSTAEARAKRLDLGSAIELARQ